MKIITWNCNRAFRRKAHLILIHKPDILIIPECEHPTKLLFPIDTPEPKNILWFGKNQNQGLAIFSYGDCRFTVLENHNQKLQYIIPITVTCKQFDFNLFAIWANNATDLDGRYIEQIWKALHYYDDILKGEKTILAGDFNSNSIWDRKRRESNHSNVVKLLEQKGIYSTYHLYYNQNQGTEIHPTLYMHKRKDKSYHIDYCFASSDLTKKLQSVEIGDYEFWSKYSDHVPVIVTFDNC